MDKIVINKETLIGIAEMCNGVERGLLLTLANTSTPLDDLQRQAFEAGAQSVSKDGYAYTYTEWLNSTQW